MSSLMAVSVLIVSFVAGSTSIAAANGKQRPQAWPADGPMATPLPPVGLRIEHVASPARGVDVPSPRFAWVHAAGQPSRRLAQAAYRIQVCRLAVARAAPWDGHTWECSGADAADAAVVAGARAGAASVAWDSGVVPSNATLNVRYGASASPLAPDASYAWRVMWWAAPAGNASVAGAMPSPWSEVAAFDTGLVMRGPPPPSASASASLSPAAAAGASVPPRTTAGLELGVDDGWRGAAWIGGDFAANKAGTDQLRAPDFGLPAGATVTRARCYVAGPSYVRLAVDGREVGDDARLGPFTTFAVRVLYDVFDCTSVLARAQANPDAGTSAGAGAGAGATTMHAVGATVANGWYSQPTIAAGPRMMRLLLSIDYALPATRARGTRAAGAAETARDVVTMGHLDVVSSDAWRATHGPTVVSDIYLGATHDVSQATPGWTQPGYDAAAPRWSAAQALPSPLLPAPPGDYSGGLRPQLMPRVRPCESRDVQAVWEPQPGVFVYDFGQNMAGTVLASVPAALVDAINAFAQAQAAASASASASASAANVTLIHAESLQPDGTVNQMYLPAAPQTTTIVLPTPTTATGGRGGDRGVGAAPRASPVVFEPWSTYYGFRYVQVQLHAPVRLPWQAAHEDGPSPAAASAAAARLEEAGTALTRAWRPDALQLTAHFVHTDLDRAGGANTSSAVLNGILHATLYSQLGTWASVPTGCTQRERRGWLGDAQLSSEGQVHVVHAAAAYSKFLDDIADCQARAAMIPGVANGSVPEVCPNYGHGAVPSDPGWGSGYAVIWYLQWRFYGDEEALATHYPRVAAYVETLIANATKAKLRGGLGCASRRQAHLLRGASTRGDADAPSVAVQGDAAACGVDAGRVAVGGAGLLDWSNHGDWVSVANATGMQCSAREALDHHHNATCCLYMECPDPIVSGYYYVTQLRMMAHAARALGRDADASRYAGLAASAGANIAAAHYDPSRHAAGYGYQSDQALLLSLGDGVLPAGQAPLVAAALAADVSSKDNHLDTGIFGAKMLLPALSTSGRLETALRVLSQTTRPSWGAWVALDNATTLFEMWGAFDGIDHKGVASRNHVMFSSYLPWVYQVLGGVAMDDSDFGMTVPDAPPSPLAAAAAVAASTAGEAPGVPQRGYASFRVRPRLLPTPTLRELNLTWLSVALDTPRGHVACAWRVPSTDDEARGGAAAGFAGSARPGGVGVTATHVALWLNVTIPVGGDVPVYVPVDTGGGALPQGAARGVGVGAGLGRGLVGGSSVNATIVDAASGRTVWRAGAFVPPPAGAPGIASAAATPDGTAVVLQAGSGSYQFVVFAPPAAAHASTGTDARIAA